MEGGESLKDLKGPSDTSHTRGTFSHWKVTLSKMGDQCTKGAEPSGKSTSAISFSGILGLRGPQLTMSCCPVPQVLPSTQVSGT